MLRRWLPTAGLPLCLLVGFATLAGDPRTANAVDPPLARQSDVIYGRKFGTALTMDIFRPAAKPNGAGVIVVISGGFVSAADNINPLFALPFTNRGYTVFAVLHGSQPRYSIPEIVTDLHRAVRFIRHHAKDYSIDPNRLGIAGASAGGHLSLMMGTAGTQGDPTARDPVDRESSRVQAVACFFPPTDFLNWGKSGDARINPMDHAKPFRPAFDFYEVDKDVNIWKPVTDPARRREISRDISPIYHVTADDAPTLIIHGDADPLVPLQQSEIIVEAFKKAGVDSKLVVKPKAAHGWPTILLDFNTLADWFDQHIGKAK